MTPTEFLDYYKVMGAIFIAIPIVLLVGYWVLVILKMVVRTITNMFENY